MAMPPKETAEAFTQQYYLILNRSPENTHKFYEESSYISWPEPNNGGDITPITTLTGINGKVMASDYKYCSVDISTIDAQESYGGGLIVYVTGLLTTQGGAKRNFNQIFFLAKQTNGYYVLNDILRSVDYVSPVSEIIATDEKKDDETAASLEILEKADETEISVPSERPESPGESFPPIEGTSGKNDLSVEVEAPKISYASVVAKVALLTSPKASLATSDARKQTNASKTVKASSPLVDDAQKAYAKVAAASQMAEGFFTFPPDCIRISLRNEARALIYVGGVPHDVTREGIADVISKFGPIKKADKAINIKRHEDGFCFAFVEFESADAAQRAANKHI